MNMEKRSTVAIAKGNDPRSLAATVMDLLGGMGKFVKPNDIVFIKPNICGLPPFGRPPEHVITDPQLVAALVEQCIAAGAKKVFVGDAPALGFSSKDIYEQVGYSGPIHDAGGQMSNVTEEGFVKVNSRAETNIPGIFAAGDITGGILQVSTAVGEGTIAAVHAYLYIKGGWYGEAKQKES